ncbi:hypothetical protein B0H19DRAFT_1062669 [Mycena capillaripes]|nr:hypothetical protein B0H19DRAFT_1062669 [Mycena capillaripes]
MLANGAGQFLFVGTGRGVVSVFPWNISNKRFEKRVGTFCHVFKLDEPVKCQAVDSTNARFVAASRQGRIKMHSIENHKVLLQMWTYNIGAVAPRALSLCLNVERGAPAPGSLELEGGAGSVALSPTGRMTAVQNILEDEFEIYHLGSPSPIRLFVSANSGKIKGAAFAQGGGELVCGGDDGFVHIFDAIKGIESQVLKHEDCSTVYALVVRYIHILLYNRITAVQTCTTKTQHLVASGGSECPANIYIWAKPTEEKLHQDHLDLMQRDAEATRAVKAAEATRAAAKAAKLAQEKRAAEDTKLDTAVTWAYIIFAAFMACAGFVWRESIWGRDYVGHLLVIEENFEGFDAAYP